ncbi:MAG: hypothetical protein Kow0010_22710 [Dehalococcoidia bacterium]
MLTRIMLGEVEDGTKQPEQELFQVNVCSRDEETLGQHPSAVRPYEGKALDEIGPVCGEYRGSSPGSKDSDEVDRLGEVFDDRGEIERQVLDCELAEDAARETGPAKVERDKWSPAPQVTAEVEK